MNGSLGTTYPSLSAIAPSPAALILANEHGPRFELATWQALVSREALQEPQAVAIKTAKSSLLQARGNHATQQVLAQTGGGHPSEHQLPLPPQPSSRSERMRRSRPRSRPALASAAA